MAEHAQDPLDAALSAAETDLSKPVQASVTVVAAEPPARKVYVSGYECYLNDDNKLNVPGTLGKNLVLADVHGIIVPLDSRGYTDLPLVPDAHYIVRAQEDLVKDMAEKEEGPSESLWNVFGGTEDEPEKKPEKKVEIGLEWKRLSPGGTLPLPRYNHSSTAVGDKVYVFGGQVEGSTSNLLFIYDSEANTWTRQETTGTVPPPRFGHTACVVNGKDIIICGGVVKKIPTIDVFVLNTETLEWSKPLFTGDIPSGRYGHSATMVNNTMYIFGGINSDDDYLNDVYSYDIDKCYWHCPDIGGAVPEGLAWHTAQLIVDKILVYGGKRKMFMFVDEYIEDVYILDLTSFEWLGPAIYGDEDLVGGRAQLIMAPLSSSKLILHGGETRWGDELSAVVLDLDARWWSRPVIGGEWPEARHGHSVSLVGTQLFVFGGMSEGWAVNSLHSLDFTKLASGSAKLVSQDTLGAQALPSTQPTGSSVMAAGEQGSVVVAQKMEEKEVPM